MEAANAAQVAAWDGDEGEDWARNATRYERSGERHRPHLVNREVLAPGDRVLDIGCGTGRTTLEAARLVGSGCALGLDLSAAMLAHAREQAAAEGVANVSFLQADAQVHPFEPGAFDVAISATGAMFFGDPVAAFGNIGRGLRRGGRLALLVWQALERNEWLTSIRRAVALGRELPVPPPDAPGHPFSLADPARVRSILGQAGFDAIELVAVDEPMVAGTDADDALAFLGSSRAVAWLLEDLDEGGRARARANLRSTFEEAETPEGVLLGSAAWLVTATRR